MPKSKKYVCTHTQPIGVSAEWGGTVVYLICEEDDLETYVYFTTFSDFPDLITYHRAIVQYGANDRPYVAYQSHRLYLDEIMRI